MQKIFDLASREIIEAEKTFGHFNSPHEFYGVLLEEIDELKDHVRGDTADTGKGCYEALQIASVCLRWIDQCNRFDSIKKSQEARWNK